MDRGVWWAAVLGAAKSRTQLSDFTLDSKETSNQSILKEINPEYSLEGLTQKLKLQ